MGASSRLSSRASSSLADAAEMCIRDRAAGQVGPVAVGRFQRWQRLKNTVDALGDQVPQCERVLDDAHLRPVRDADSSALNGKRVKQAVEEHRVDKRPNIRMLKRHVGLG